ncbi:hypothetical protein [Catenovulum adriaticum]|uniref:Uncharacterized protein n=1 Tax=Catenovulum adriaticum TaxID=2984846 RepID=A0ABY7AMY9_9ALTE|nr:hypothetical protein [Catenovulum sp. TS8]WAJ70927.1 hypothetical protein OLW01_03750 [Catenovulum sp. TS8]
MRFWIINLHVKGAFNQIVSAIWVKAQSVQFKPDVLFKGDTQCMWLFMLIGAYFAFFLYG